MEILMFIMGLHMLAFFKPDIFSGGAARLCR